MISTKVFRMRSTKLAMIFCGFISIMLLSTLIDGAYENYTPGINELTIVREENIPVREISGLHLTRNNENHSLELFSIGDKYATIGVSKINDGEDKIEDSYLIDATKPIVDRFAVCQSLKIPSCKKHMEHITSQWEAITQDGSQRLFLLHEQLASIFIYNRNNQHIDHVINLDTFDLKPTNLRHRVTSNQANALGEGMILMKNGHILVIKERQKANIIEFAPEGEHPSGYHKSLSILPNITFPIPNKERIVFLPIKRWKIPKGYKNCDLSEINSDDEGRLFLMSQSCQWIAKLKDLVATEDYFAFEDFWSLPRALKRAEAFAVLGHEHFIVAEDKKSKNKENIYFLKKI